MSNVTIQKSELDKAIEICETYPILSAMTLQERLKIDALNLNMLATFSILLESWDNRQKVPQFYRLPFYDEYIKIMNRLATFRDNKKVETSYPRCKNEVTFNLKLVEKDK
jgi:hypothetical protein